MKKILEADICVIGGGSGGYSAAIRAAQSGCRTVLVEQERVLGGTSTVCGVNCWEPVAGASFGLSREIHDKMKQTPFSCGIYHVAKHFCLKDPRKQDFPGGLYRIDPSLTYDDTLKKGYVYGGPWNLDVWNGVIFEPEALDACVRKMLTESGCEVIMGHRCEEVFLSCRQIRRVRLDDGIEITARQWIDNSGVVALLSKCRLLIGCDSATLFDEPDAPQEPDPSKLNGVTLVFRISPSDRKCVEKCQEQPKQGVMVAVEYPNGDYSCNMLPTMTGAEYFSMDKDAALAECIHRVRSFWRYVQENYEEWRNYRIAKIFSKPGIRENFRVCCDYMLKENDLIAGFKNQPHQDMIVIADHHMDLHGMASSGKTVLPYGIPYRSLLPENMENLLVSGRISGFSCLAASSCRLSRTIIRLGEAAGYAAAMAVKGNCRLREIPIRELQDKMQFLQEIAEIGS